MKSYNDIPSWEGKMSYETICKLLRNIVCQMEMKIFGCYKRHLNTLRLWKRVIEVLAHFLQLHCHIYFQITYYEFEKV